MQEDKGLLPAGNITWAENMARMVQPFCHSVVISVNAAQESYAAALPSFTLVTDEAGLQIRGPLQGLLSVHMHFPEEDLFLLACDMQQMKPDVLQRLEQQYRASGEKDAWVYASPKGGYEPLAGIYSAVALAKMLRRHHHQPLAKPSMKYLLEQLDVSAISLPAEWEKCFANFNTPADRKALLPPC